MTDTIEPGRDTGIPEDAASSGDVRTGDAAATQPATVLRLVDVAQSVPDGRYRRMVLDGVDLEVRRGELVALMGPSGSGKTTLLRIAAGLDRPERGMPVIDGEHLWVLSANDLADLRRRCVGYVEQRWNLLDSLTVLENVSLPLELDGVVRREAMRLAMEALEDVGITELSHVGSPPTSQVVSSSGARSPGRLSAHVTCWWPTSRRAPSTRSPPRR
ncbi:MAG: ABC transporter ATP-binding protein [Microthrixaceae bacterium]|nr:ABC transporter ATP-binding protein [Microthrixaceae bacterium]